MTAARVLESEAAHSLSAPVIVLIGICSLIYLLDGLIHSILGPLAPDMARSLSLSNAQLGPIFSANLIGQCVGLVLFPVLANRLGHRSVVLLAVVGFGLGQCASALSVGAADLFGWRFVTGVFLGGCLPSCLAIVSDVAPSKRRGLAIMLLFTGYGLGATIAGLIAAAFENAGGWRAAMVVVGAVCFLTALVAWMGLEIPSRATVTGGSRTAEAKATVLGILAPRYLLRTLMLWLLFVAMLTISYCLNSWLPTLLVEVGRDRTLAAISVSIFSLGGIVAALGVGLLIDRFGAMRTLISFVAFSAALLFAVGRVLETASVELLLTLLGACGFFVLGAYGGVNVVLADSYPDYLRATGIGWAKSVGRIGTVIAPILIGYGLSAGATGSTIMSWFALPAALAVLSLIVVALATQRAA
jgi:MFS transporter, AAHS family, 4-hydroxybenzoate transporter